MHTKLLRLAAITGVSIPSASVVAFSATATSTSNSLQSLVITHQDAIASLKDIASKISEDEAIAPTSDVFYLRYVLNDAYEDEEARHAALQANLGWRANEGKAIVTGAYAALQAATAGGGTWNNAPIRDAAPHAAIINEYLTTVQCITTTLSSNDLLYCVRAGKIDDKELMSKVTVEQMVDFFLYCKEVNAAAADLRSVRADALLKVVTVNDLSGVKLIGSSSEFRAALSAASKKGNELYPSLNGRTLLLNLPTLLGALVKIFNKLLPAAVRERIRFESGPLKHTADLREIAEGGAGRVEFLSQMDVLAYGK